MKKFYFFCFLLGFIFITADVFSQAGDNEKITTSYKKFTFQTYGLKSAEQAQTLVKEYTSKIGIFYAKIDFTSKESVVIANTNMKEKDIIEIARLDNAKLDNIQSEVIDQKKFKEISKEKDSK